MTLSVTSSEATNVRVTVCSSPRGLNRKSDFNFPLTRSSAASY